MNSRASSDVITRVLHGVVEPFVPTVTMMVYYGNHRLINGSELRLSVAEITPRVLIGGEHDELYTLIMIDPDAPNPDEPALREVVTWIVTNIPGGESSTQGNEFMSYDVPNPQVGVHRHIMLLFRQRGPLNGIETLESRVHFRTRDFANTHNLDNPVGVAYFNVRRQAS
ncbi:hypothetical protein M8C21_002882 [Ambrosia artemisiifolia]|uniref:Uncharacterized protein n=1 Tax=Ambrosia artemisiifolia TaxID=4212 RepID=A0AAD5D0T8_AMBAR|nr:hypothetical protein M8C21_002882 [Ambrosia artemisiifolia]